MEERIAARVLEALEHGPFQRSAGGRAGKGRRGGGGRARQAADTALGQPRARDTGGGGAAARPERPQWQCGVCLSENWLSRHVCRACKVPRQLDVEHVAGKAAAAQRETPATGANTVALGAGAGQRAIEASRAQAAAAAPASRPPATSRAASVTAVPAAAVPQAASAMPGGGGALVAVSQTEPQGGAQQAVATPARLGASAVRAAEGKRLARIDAALSVLGTEDASATAALQQARRECASRIAETQPLGRRLATARKAHAKAQVDLARAEAAALAASEVAQRALEVEHTLAAQVLDLEHQVNELQLRDAPAPLPAQTVQFVENMHSWLAGLGLEPPPELRAEAAALRGAVTGGPRSEPTAEGEEGDPVEEPSSPTDAHAPLSPAVSTTAGRGAAAMEADSAGKRAGEEAGQAGSKQRRGDGSSRSPRRREGSR